MRNFSETWHSNDRVTSRHTPGETGNVIVIHRKSDDARFTKVYILTGPRKGQRVWSSEGFDLGSGPYQHTCLECDQPYRDDKASADFCPACERSQRPNAPNEPLPASRLWKYDQDRRRR